MTLSSKNTLLGWSPLIGAWIGGIGVFILPLVLWLVWRDEDSNIDQIGKNIVNSQISWTIWCLLAIPLCFIVIGFAVYFIYFILLIILGCNIMGGNTSYVMPLTIKFIK